MQISLDVVDLLQLQEIWSKRPIVTAFTRLEPRSPRLPSRYDFAIEDLLPRLARLKRSPVWLMRRSQPSDPARMPLCELSDELLTELYPEAESPRQQRQFLFTSAYARFVVAHYRDAITETTSALHTLACARQCRAADFLNHANWPEQGAEEWIPADITDEIRDLDGRYDPAQPGAPATFVIADDFWPLLTKAVPEDIEMAAQLGCVEGEADCGEALRRRLGSLVGLAHTWYRSPSVVGLCYQVHDE